MFRTAVQSAAVEAPSVKTGSEHTTHRMFSHASSAACVRKAQDGGNPDQRVFSYCHLRENKPIIQEQMTA